MDKVKLISYDGSYPNLCAGTLIIAVVNDITKTYVEWVFPPHSLSSGGYIDGDYEAHSGSWEIEDWPDEFPMGLRDDVIDLVNSEIEHGCCGGCI